MSPLRSLCAGITALVLILSARASTLLVDDTFSDGSSRNQDLTANSLNVFDGRTGPTGTSGGANFTRTEAVGSFRLNLATSTSSQAAWAFFTGNQTSTTGTPPVSSGAWTNTAPLALQVGDTLTFLEKFSVSGLKSGQDIRVGLFDSGGTRTMANTTGGQNDASFSNDLGYGLDFFLSPGSPAFLIGKRDLALASSLSSLNNPFLNLGSFPALPGAPGAILPATQTLANDTVYTLTLSVYRKDAGTNVITATVSGGALPSGYSWQVVDGNAPQTTFDSFTAARFNGAAFADSITFTAFQVIYSPALPVITAQPTFASGGTTQTIGIGGQVILSVGATGAGLTYQWRHDGSPLPAATTPQVTLTQLQLTDSGTYDVVVTNGGGSVTSAPVTLTVINGTVSPPPTLDTQPVSQAVNNGTSVTFAVGASGENLTYQWYKNGAILPGANSATLLLASVTPSDAGNYRVAVSNEGGTVNSSDVSLTVLSPNLVVTNLTPAATSGLINPDSPLRITFAGPPAIGLAGTIKIYDAATDAVVDTIDASSPRQTGNLSYLPGTPYQTKTIGGVGSFNYYPVIVAGNTATVFPRNGALAYGKTYYVKIDSGFFNDSLGSFAGINDLTTWRFTTKPSGPAPGSTFLTVAADGTGDFNTVQGALDFIPNGNTAPTTIFIRKGTYTEIVYFQSKSGITFLGEDRQATVITYANNNNFNSAGGVYHRGVLYGNNVSNTVVTNLALRNATPQNGSQAEALILTASSVGQNIVTRVDLFSFQDTLQLNGPTYVSDSYIEGDVDFIWGNGPSFFAGCDLKILRTGGFFTQIRNDATHHGFVFLNCRLSAAPGVTGTYLARIDPNVGQFPNSEVVWLNSTMDNFVSPAGWLLNNATAAPTVHFWEYHSTTPAGTPLDVSGRAPFSRQLTLPNDAQTIADYSTPSFVLGGWSPQLAPLLVQQPANQTVTVGQYATFKVAAVAIPNPTYQWFKDGAPIPNATASSYTLASVAPADVGNYSVVVTNPVGSVTTSPASLSLSSAAPVITTSPASQTVLIGTPAMLTFAATGAAPFTYQWNKDNSPLPGATGPSLTLPNAQVADTGSYSVTVTNSQGTATSSSATLTVVAAAASTPPPLPVIPSALFKATAFGAVGDGVTDNTAAIQAALNAAHGAGGGTVELPASLQPYLCGPITLRSNTRFQIDGGATLQLLPFGTYPNSTTSPSNFITIPGGSSHVAITGAGTIDGQGRPWWNAYNAGTITNRPRLVQVNRTDTLLISGISLVDAPQFNLAFNNPTNITLVGLTITAPSDAPNTDGIDPTGTHYLIQNCAISVGDDNIAVKASAVFTGDITIAHCTFGTGHGVSIGGQTNAGIDGMVVSDCRFNGTSTGLRLKADPTQGGLVQNLRYSDITMTGVPYPIVFYSYYNQLGTPGAVSGSSQITPAKVNAWNAAPPNPLNTSTLPAWKNIRIDHLTATGATGYSILWGLPLADNLISAVTLNNVKIAGGAGLEIYDAADVQLIGDSDLGPLITANALAITGQPQSQSIAPGATVAFTVKTAGASGTSITPPTYQWTFNGSPLIDGPRSDGAVISGATSRTLTLTGARAAEAGQYAAIVSNSLDGYDLAANALAPNSLPVSAISQPATLTVSSAFTAFVTRFGLDPATTGAAEADPDGDGIPNALEFVLGSDPTVPDNTVLPVGSLALNGEGNRVLVYQFDRQISAASAVSSWVEYSEDLVNWTRAVDGQNGIAISITPLDSTTERVTVVIPATNPRIFARLKASEI